MQYAKTCVRQGGASCRSGYTVLELIVSVAVIAGITSGIIIGLKTLRDKSEFANFRFEASGVNKSVGMDCKDGVYDDVARLPFGWQWEEKPECSDDLKPIAGIMVTTDKVCRAYMKYHTMREDGAFVCTEK